MKYRLTNEDIAMIAELRKQNIEWKHIAKIYNMHWSSLQGIFKYRMKSGFLYQ